MTNEKTTATYNDEKRPTGGEYCWGGRSPLRSLFWALAFIMLGSLLFAQSQGWLGGDKWFSYFLIGLGGIFLLDVAVHYLHPDYHYFSFGRTMAGIIFASIGFSLLVGFTHWVSLGLVLIGIAIAGGFFIRGMHGSRPH